MIRQAHRIAVVGAFLIGCAVLVVVGCAGVRSEAPQKEEQAHIKATASEEARCEGTRTIGASKVTPIMTRGGLITTNDIPGCPYGGLLIGTDGREELQGRLGDDEIHGLSGVDAIEGGGGNDIIYAGPGDDTWLSGDDGDDVIYGGAGNEEEMYGFDGKDVLYGGDGNDYLDGYGKAPDVLYGGDGNDLLDASGDHNPDKLYCGEGRDEYRADKIDYVDSCEKKAKPPKIIADGPVPPES